MWDLETIIRINHEAGRSAKEKNSIKACIEASIQRNEGIWDPEKGIFGQVTYLRSVYEGEVDRHPPQGGTGEVLP
jgi:hypothetical protein